MYGMLSLYLDIRMGYPYIFSAIYSSCLSNLVFYFRLQTLPRRTKNCHSSLPYNCPFVKVNDREQQIYLTKSPQYGNLLHTMTSWLSVSSFAISTPLREVDMVVLESVCRLSSHPSIYLLQKPPRVDNNENINAPHHWSFGRGNSLVAGGFPSQTVGNAESVSMAWRHHVPLSNFVTDTTVWHWGKFH